jgi:hypothetical protein
MRILLDGSTAYVGGHLGGQADFDPLWSYPDSRDIQGPAATGNAYFIASYDVSGRRPRAGR